MNILKNIFAIIVILIFVGASFFFLVIEGGVYQELFGDTATSSTSNVSSDSAASTNQLVQTLQDQLIELDRVKIDSEFFESDAFKQLESNRQELPVLEGRKENPFLSE